MSTETHHNTKPHKEHGTIASYVIGFILSLVFTVIPYHLVVNKVLTGNDLLAAILGIAVLQMAIQLIFFLHLGRGPKPFYNVVFFFATASIIVVTIGASLFIMDNLYENMLPEETVTRLAQEENIAQIGGTETGACKVGKNNHIVTIQDSIASPLETEAHLCDTLTFINDDEEARKIIFGSHPEHPESYGGIFEVIVRSGRPETITLNEAGEFMFHDSLDTDVSGQFTVISH